MEAWLPAASIPYVGMSRAYLSSKKIKSPVRLQPTVHNIGIKVWLSLDAAEGNEGVAPT